MQRHCSINTGGQFCCRRSRRAYLLVRRIIGDQASPIGADGLVWIGVDKSSSPQLFHSEIAGDNPCYQHPSKLLPSWHLYLCHFRQQLIPHRCLMSSSLW